jgi:murein tripeptide amidase MpaA
MLNIDGVVVGNTRTAINGLDLNRCWGNNVSFSQAPEIVSFKE